MKLKLTTVFFFATILFFSTVDYARAGTIQSMDKNFSNAVLPVGVPVTVSGVIDFYKREPIYPGSAMMIAYKLDGVYMPYIWNTYAPYPCCGQNYSGSVGPFTEGQHTIQFVVYVAAAYGSFSQEFYPIQTFTAAPLTAKILTPVSNPTSYGTGSNIYFSGWAEGGSASDGLSTYEWRKGSCSTGTLLASTMSFQKNNFSAGQHTIYLRVKDSSNTWSTNCPSRTINISANGVPTAVITDPVDTYLVIAPGDSVFFSGYGIDPDGDTITQYVWFLFGYRWPQAISTETSFSRSFPTAADWTVYLMVKDSNNNWSSNSPSRYIRVVSSPAATLSASPTSCTIASGASTCNIPFTWNIINAPSPNLYNSTRANTYSTSASGTNLSYAITNGSNTVQARNSSTVLKFVITTGSCVAGTAWSGGSCVSVSAPCTLESTTIPSGGNITAYQFSSIPSPNTCASVSETRNCNNGILSGSYQYDSCSVNTSCNLPWGGTISSGNSVTAYQASSVISPTTCASVSQTRACADGVLSGTYTNQNCTVSLPKTRFWQF